MSEEVKIEDVLKTVDEDKLNCYNAGTLLTISSANGLNEFARILKVIEGKEISEDFKDDIFAVLGTYHLEELIDKVSQNAEEPPTLYLMAGRVLDEKTIQMLHSDEKFTEDQKVEIYDKIQELSNDDQDVTDQINELLNLSVMTCIPYTSQPDPENIKQIEENMKAFADAQTQNETS